MSLHGRRFTGTSGSPPDAGPSLGLRCLHLVVLSALTVAQPLLDILASHVETIVTRRLDALDIGLLAVAVLVIPPVPGIAVELILARSKPFLRNTVHTVMIGGFGVLASLLILRRTPLVSTEGIWTLAILGGTIVAVGYARIQAVRSMVSLMAIGLLVVPATFLFNRDIAQLVHESTSTSAQLPQLECDAPIVFLVFDEFSTLVLLDQEGRINPHRYPNLARLSERATFYRAAETVAESTEFAVPSIVTGRLPDPEKKPRYRDHPENLFTLFGGSYRIWASEAFTKLVPEELNLADDSHQSRGQKWLVLGTDLSVVYLHLVLPPAQVGKLPQIGVTWQGFAAEWFSQNDDDRKQEKRNFLRRALDALKEDRRSQFESLIDAVATIGERDLFFAHVLLPHRPWEFLPDRRRYPTGRPATPGILRKAWRDNTFHVLQGYQRYILQVMFLDAEIGRLMDQLNEQGWFDRAMIVIVADHGVAFGRGEHTRQVTTETAHELVLVPMIVKAPGQTEGKVIDAPVRTIDLLPIVLDLLGVESPWPMAGQAHPATSDKPDHPNSVFSRKHGLVEIPNDVVAEGFRAVNRKVRAFGDGSDPLSIYRIGPFQQLIGRSIDEIPQLEDAPLKATLKSEEWFEDVDPSDGSVPVFIRAILSGTGVGSSGNAVAVGVNGRIASTAPSVLIPPDTHVIDVMIPPESLVAGRNTIEFFKILRRPEGPALRRIPLK